MLSIPPLFESYGMIHTCSKGSSLQHDEHQQHFAQPKLDIDIIETIHKTEKYQLNKGKFPT